MDKCFWCLILNCLDDSPSDWEPSMKIWMEGLLEMSLLMMIFLHFGDFKHFFKTFLCTGNNSEYETYWLQLLCLALFLVIRKNKFFYGLVFVLISCWALAKLILNSRLKKKLSNRKNWSQSNNIMLNWNVFSDFLWTTLTAGWNSLWKELPSRSDSYC